MDDSAMWPKEALILLDEGREIQVHNPWRSISSYQRTDHNHRTRILGVRWGIEVLMETVAFR